MNFNDYQTKAALYRLPTADETYVLFNLASEVGELFGKLAKAIRDETKLEVDEIAKEMGDILWHLASLSDDLCLDLEDIAQGNLDKLESRKLRNALQGSGDNR